MLGIVVFSFSRRSSGGIALLQREKLMEALGARIAELRPNTAVLVLANPFARDAGYFNERNQFERAAVRGLKKGLGQRSPVTLVAPEIRPEYLSNPESIFIPPDSRTPLSFLMLPSSVDQLAQAHPEARVIVSLIGLPAEPARLQAWSGPAPRGFALLLPDLALAGDATAVIEAFRSEKILAAVFEHPTTGAPVVVTRENIAQLLEQQPALLGF